MGKCENQTSPRAISTVLWSPTLSTFMAFQTVVNPHDLRRSYARLLYEAGVDVVAIQQNMGHVYIRETLSYIGELDAHHRTPPSAF